MYDFLFGELEDDAIAARRTGNQKKNKLLSAATSLTLFGLLLCFFYFAPLTYAWPGLTPEQVRARQWLKFTLHFAK
jgi:dolichyl-phosphate-mannose-protein mannosyltransferase